MPPWRWSFSDSPARIFAKDWTLTSQRGVPPFRRNRRFRVAGGVANQRPVSSVAMSAASFSSIELASPDQVRQVQTERLVAQVEYLLAHSTYYRRKFAEAGIGSSVIRSIDDLERIPFTVKQDLQPNAPRTAAPPQCCPADPALP